MRVIVNILAAVGVVALCVIAFAYPKLSQYASRFSEFDPKAGSVYMELADKLMESGNIAEATVWKAKVSEDLSFEDLEETIRFVANENNIKNVGELPLSNQVAAMTGKDYRTAKIYMFCNALTAAMMMDHNDAYSAYLPCRVTVVEDKSGALWIYTLNMDPMIYGGTPLPPALKEEAETVKRIIRDIMDRGASGEF